MGNIKKLLALLSLVILLSSCSKRVPIADTFQGKGLKIGEVAISRGELPEEREDRANRIQLEEQIKTKIEESLKAKGLYDPSSKIAMRIHINQFRLRHGATRYFTGFFSGSDMIGAQLTISDDVTTFVAKPLEVSGGNGNPFAISSSSRGANLSAAIANLAVASLQRDALSTSSTVATNIEAAPVPIPEKKTNDTTRSKDLTPCSVDQILALKKNGLSDKQIKAACPGAIGN